MCIRVPGQVLAVSEDVRQLAQAGVYGIKRDVNIALICEGDTARLVRQWVLVHIGFTMSIVNEDETKATLDALRRMEYDVTSAWFYAGWRRKRLIRPTAWHLCRPGKTPRRHHQAF